MTCLSNSERRTLRNWLVSILNPVGDLAPTRSHTPCHVSNPLCECERVGTALPVKGLATLSGGNESVPLCLNTPLLSRRKFDAASLRDYFEDRCPIENQALPKTVLTGMIANGR